MYIRVEDQHQKGREKSRMKAANYKQVDQSRIACLPADMYKQRTNGKIRYKEKEKKRKDENNNNNHHSNHNNNTAL